MNLDDYLPTVGYEILEPPVNYMPLVSSNSNSNQYFIPEASVVKAEDIEKDLIPDTVPEDVKQAAQSIIDLKTQSWKAISSAKPKIVMEAIFVVSTIVHPHVILKLLLKVLRTYSKLDITPYTKQIIVTLTPFLAPNHNNQDGDDGWVVRKETHEVLSMLVRLVGLPPVLTSVREELETEGIERGLAVMTYSVGIGKVLPFIRALVSSRKSELARNVGIKVIRQLALVAGAGVLPYLQDLVDILVKDGQTTGWVNAVTSLAEASYPFGIEAFEPVLEPIWTGVRKMRGRSLVQYLRCVGMLIVLMDPEYANYYAKQVMGVVVREFETQDDEMRKVVLKVLQQCIGTDGGADKRHLKEVVLPGFFRNFWIRRMALDKRNVGLVVETSVQLAGKVGYNMFWGKIIDSLNDESEPYRKLGIQTLESLVKTYGTTEIPSSDDNTDEGRTELRLVDAALSAFQTQSLPPDPAFLSGLCTFLNGLGPVRAAPYVSQTISTALFRLSHHEPSIRQQSAQLLGMLTPVLVTPSNLAIVGKIQKVLLEQLGEEYPEVLAEVVNALDKLVEKAGCVEATDMVRLVSPILKNRNEKVQVACITLLGHLTLPKATSVTKASPKEWMRISFDLLTLLKSPQKLIRRQSTSTFTKISNLVGPHDLLLPLLTNLRVQDRQSRICTAVALALIAHHCGPFTLLPALLNEYRVPEVNVRNGILKTISFLFEYCGPEDAKRYVYPVSDLISDALKEREVTHRQTSAMTIAHLSINLIGQSREPVLVHFLALLLPNIIPSGNSGSSTNGSKEGGYHFRDRLDLAISGLIRSLGLGIIMNYIWAGLFHPVKRVRAAYWRIYNLAYVLGGGDGLMPYYPVECGQENIEDGQSLVQYDNGGISGVEEMDVFI